jgi:hypothetical protein
MIWDRLSVLRLRVIDEIVLETTGYNGTGTGGVYFGYMNYDDKW